MEEAYGLSQWTNNKYCQLCGESAVETLQIHHTLYDERMLSTSWVLEQYHSFLNGHESLHNDVSKMWLLALCNNNNNNNNNIY